MATKPLQPATHPRWQPRCRALPPEVWINIFRYHTDLAHLWLACRRISSPLRACAEYAFAKYFLQDVHIDFQLEKYNLGGKSKRPEVPVTFDRLGKRSEEDIAWYRDHRAMETVCDGHGKKGQKWFQDVMCRWEENVNGWKPEMPNYTITIGGSLVNDTALPGLSIDTAAREIRFMWREMLHLFFREHERLQILRETWQIQTTKRIQENNARLRKGEKLLPADYPLPWHTAEAEMRKDIRRARLKEHYRHDEEMVWAITSLSHFEQYGAAGGSARAFTLDVDLPGAGLGEKWFGRSNLVQELFLDEWSCMHRIDTKREHLRSGL
ncbi:uncharacterized protein K460DRAFT_400544 [Cucurbitaria berberidis CBS 394.84]|uniref:F-box domain-containing protein n=1 Tax=Cucurbitaria berberidis CBS 394.84 TaxID=1168544 RepID=A0A9P4GSF4_9PLEO|nr:uncharacterized protein K460DRAFT_400544 [Cucurbitaria berberidis CBS 394.84]KAF1850482.1 hypothetical protein K460DRAFT_400544 [Cucurbitaria berberidis CBS 394.84]